MTLFKIDGADFTDVLLENSMKWSRNDLDADGSGRSVLNGGMARRRITTKRKLSFQAKRLPQKRIEELCAALDKEYVTIYAPDPQEGFVTRTFYGSSVEAGLFRVMNGVAYWDDCSFSLIEK